MDIMMIVIFISYFILFLIFVLGLKYVYKLYDKYDDKKILKTSEYIPDEEFQTLKQVYYLSIISLSFINILIILVLGFENVTYFAIFEIILSVILFESMPHDSLKDKLVLFLIIPFSSLMFLATGMDLFFLWDLLRIIGLAYAIQYYYHKFMQYTESNGLGITILLLFSIIFISLFLTVFSERVELLDALTMVSNAFTSNGYTVLGSSVIGKLNSVFLVWSGYILSSVGTATLTTALIFKRYDNKIKELEELIKENGKK